MRISAERFIELLSEAGYEPRRYSGRAMYGRQCVGVEQDRGSAARVGAEMMKALVNDALDAMPIDDPDEFADSLDRDMDALSDLMRDAREDSMGLGRIVYWPDVEWVETDDACPGCGCRPGDGVTPGCDDPDGCGAFKERNPTRWPPRMGGDR